jgi:hypothetical protein
MSRTLTFKDYSMISAYIDGRCSAHEKKTVERLLESDTNFQQALTEFNRSKKMLKAIPQVKAPRNFTLSPSIAPLKPQRFFLAPMLNYAALAAVVLFVFLFAGSNLLPLTNAKRAMAPEAAMMTAADSTYASEPTLMPMITWNQYGGIGGKGGGGGGAEGSGLGGVGGGAPQALSGVTSEGITTESLPEITATTTGEQPLTVEAPTASNPIMGLPAESEQGKVLSTYPSSTIQRRLLTLVEIGEISLATLALIFVVTAWIVRKRR